MADSGKGFLGNGWKFPPQLDARGRIALVQEEDDVEEAVRIILTTQRGERQMRPTFGSELHRLQFAASSPSTCGLACRYVREALEQWEPRIDRVEPDAQIDPADPARLLITIRYRLRATNTVRNLVFPFYLIPGEK